MITSTPPRVISAWVQSIGNATPKQMSSFYTNDAILLATYSTLLTGKQEIYNYFVDFLNKKNMSCRILKNFTQNCSRGGCQISSGIYEFSFTDENEKRQIVVARYSYAVNGGLIINHHSSEDPE
jgi:hypothetical protein